ncbi:unnamed protein product [Ilex paraguariensis]|uniref:RNase H type-1 domain-containing protein n=1 Tax=Ilex paraguariensis TaxID=185542 RepID=A0ABC8SJT6_9AQUA
MRALLDGLSLIYDYGMEVYDWEIETDSQSMFCRIQHVYREGNSVADALANQGVMDQSTRLYLNQGELPISIRLLLQHDQREIKAIRKSIWDLTLFHSALLLRLELCKDGLGLWNFWINHRRLLLFCGYEEEIFYSVVVGICTFYSVALAGLSCFSEDLLESAFSLYLMQAQFYYWLSFFFPAQRLPQLNGSGRHPKKESEDGPNITFRVDDSKKGDNFVVSRNEAKSEEGSLSEEGHNIAFRAIVEAQKNCVKVNNRSASESNSNALCLRDLEEENQAVLAIKTSKKKSASKKRKVQSDPEALIVETQGSLQQMGNLNSDEMTLNGYYESQQNVQGLGLLDFRPQGFSYRMQEDSNLRPS